MNTYKQGFGTILLVLLMIATLGLTIVNQKTLEKQKVGGGIAVEIPGVATIASSTVTTSSTLVLATTTSAVYRAVVNDGATTLYISVGSPAISGKGIRVNANGGVVEFGGDALLTGAIYGISSGTINVTTLEK